jgi:hypothetical protein
MDTLNVYLEPGLVGRQGPAVLARGEHHASLVGYGAGLGLPASDCSWLLLASEAICLPSGLLKLQTRPTMRPASAPHKAPQIRSRPPPCPLTFAAVCSPSPPRRRAEPPATHTTNARSSACERNHRWWHLKADLDR